MRLEGAVCLTPSAVDLVPIALASVLRSGAVALAAVRTKAVVHPLVLREVLEPQPFTTTSAALKRLLRDHAVLSCEVPASCRGGGGISVQMLFRSAVGVPFRLEPDVDEGVDGDIDLLALVTSGNVACEVNVRRGLTGLLRLSRETQSGTGRRSRFLFR